MRVVVGLRHAWHVLSYWMLVACLSLRRFVQNLPRVWCDAILVPVTSVLGAKNANDPGGPRGRKPKQPNVLGIVLVQKGFWSQEGQALSRILMWWVVAVHVCC